MSGQLTGVVAGLAAELGGTVGTQGTGSGDVSRPIYSVMQAAATTFAVAAAGGTQTLNPAAPVAGIYIEECQITGTLAATTAQGITLLLKDNGVSVAAIHAPAAAAGGTVFNVTGLLKKYLSPNSGTRFSLTYPGIAGLSGVIGVNFTYATTAQIGP